MEFQLKQRGRASIDFAADLAGVAGRLSFSVNSELQKLELADDMDARDEQVTAAADGINAHWFATRMGEWSGTSHGVITHEAFEEIKDELLPAFETLRQGPTQIEANPNLDYPEYWQNVDFHRTTGGWTREHQGFIHGELIHPLYVGKNFPGGIFKQRFDVLSELPERAFANIVEFGTSSGHYTLQLARKYPDAALTGVELSLPMLEQAQRFANEQGLKWRLIQAPAEQTGLPDASADLVTSYILLHELPETATRAVFAEAFRLLEPDGYVFMSDIRPTRDLDKLAQWRSMDNARRGGEPYWCEAAGLDLAAVASDAGFVDARTYGLGQYNYPWVTIARKPKD
ncbi:MAG: class I SAM-dependent methyltransferase [Pseudomonadota bacterium]